MRCMKSAVLARQTKTRSVPKKIASRSALFLILLLASCAAAIYVIADSTRSNAIVVQAAARGKGLLNPRDGRLLKVEYAGDAAISEAMRAGTARPLTLATGDFDGDGAPDLVTGYGYSGGGILSVQRGNLDAFAPKDLKIYDRAAKGELPPSFAPTAQTIQLPESPDFLLVGDFNDDGHKDLLTAAHGGGLYLLTGDGRGGFGKPEQLELPGQVTALTAGAFSHAGGLQAVIAGVVGPKGPALAIFTQDGNGLARNAQICALQTEATALALGSFDDDPYSDLGVAAGSEIIIVHGEKQSGDQAVDLSTRMEHIELGFNARGLAAGRFVPDEAPRQDLAALSSDGTVHILQRHQLSSAAPDNAVDQFAGLAPNE